MEGRPPPVVQRGLEQGPLDLGSLGDQEHPLLAHPHVEPLLGDDPLQDPAVRAIGAVLEHGLLGSQGGRVDQERDGHLVAPSFGPVVEDVVEPGPTSEKVFQHLSSVFDPHVGGHHVQEVTMADLVLGFGQHSHLVPEAGSLWNPVPLGQPAHQLAVGVHLDEGEDGLPVGVGHVVVDLHNPSVIQEGLEGHHGGPRPSHQAISSSGAPFTPGRLATMVRTS